MDSASLPAASPLRRPPASTLPTPPRWSALVERFLPAARTALEESILPFWWRTLDAEHGGVFNCWNNAGTQLIGHDKFSWSQGRFAWLWSRLAQATGGGLLAGDSARYCAHAGKTVDFLRAHALLEDGRCAFLLSADGRERKEPFPGAGVAASIYADCFVMMGFAEYASAAGDRAALDAAWRLLDSIATRIAAGGFPSHPYPVPAGHEAYAVAMIHLNLTLVLHEACVRLGDAREAEAAGRMSAAAEHILRHFMQADGRIAEYRTLDGREVPTLLTRHVTPGHSLEGLWMLMLAARALARPEWLERAALAVRYAFDRGWDREHGGLLLYVDRDGGPPAGAYGTSPYESHVLTTWETKLWWVHSEALYASLLSYRLTGDEVALEWFERGWEYAFRVFPHLDPAVGEWIQIRDRQGRPLQRVVALPVKDPYHIARNLLQLVELMSAPFAPAKS